MVKPSHFYRKTYWWNQEICWRKDLGEVHDTLDRTYRTIRRTGHVAGFQTGIETGMVWVKIGYCNPK